MLRNLKRLFFNRKYVFLVGIVILFSMAFAQGYKTTHDLHWAYDIDFDRDLSFIQGSLDGNLGKDPNYLGEYLWYSPLLFSIETAIVKITGLPPNIVVTRAGIYLNCLAPAAFVFMVLILFGFETGIASLLSFLFLASGNILGWGAATYSPWLYPVCFVQFLFYLNIIFLFKALSTQRYFWFTLLGSFTGLAFLGHVAPAVIIILMIIVIQTTNLATAIRGKNRKIIERYIFQSLILAATFLIVSSPVLIVIYGRYKMHYLNRAPFEYNSGIFTLKSFGGLIKANMNLAFLIASAGVYWFYRNFKNQIVRSIITCWLMVCIGMYIYSSLVPLIHSRLHIFLPVTVPSFHYFFYLKGLESVFFGIGLVWLLKSPVNWLAKRLDPVITGSNFARVRLFAWVSLILLFSIAYYPVYRTRDDFVYLRAMAIKREGDKSKLEVYNYIKEHIPSDKVILCELNESMFPVMASGRKMVSTTFTFSNPFVDFELREKDRNSMLSYLVSESPLSDKQLFSKYQVDYILLSSSLAEKIKPVRGITWELIFKNKSFILLSIRG